jgi:S-DNA-T family DNA segregation ATPase FtsK/SpoIIIE
VFELKGTGDLDALGKVAHHSGSGADDETIEAALASLRQVAEVELVRRAKVIRELPKDQCPESKVTPQLAARRSLRLHPLVFGLDEAQEAFSHSEYGPMFARYDEQVNKRGPALGIILLLATQRPDAKSLSTGVTSNVSMRFCLRVMDQVANDMVLGTSAYKTGVRATLMTVTKAAATWSSPLTSRRWSRPTTWTAAPLSGSVTGRASCATRPAPCPGTRSGRAMTARRAVSPPTC